MTRNPSTSRAARRRLATVLVPSLAAALGLAACTAPTTTPGIPGVTRTVLTPGSQPGTRGPGPTVGTVVRTTPLFYDDEGRSKVGLDQFALDPGRWSTTQLTYRLANTTPDLTPAATRAAIGKAFALWEAQSPLHFREVSTGGDIVISWVSGDRGDGHTFDGPNGKVAHAFSPPPTTAGELAGDIQFDEAETWTDGERSDPSQPVDLVTVAAHQIGQALGLHHAADPRSLMYPFYSGSHRSLFHVDTEGIQAAYPVGR